MSRIGKTIIPAVFLVGCVAGVISREVFTVPMALAQGGADKWDYFCIHESEFDKLGPKLKAAGAQGWELTAAESVFGSDGRSAPSWCMKRRLP